MPKRQPTTLPAYNPDRLDGILQILARASDDPSDVALTRLRGLRDDLEADLLSWIHATGLAHDISETSLIWHEVKSEAPSHAQLAAGFTAMAKAARPLDPKICKPGLELDLSARIRNRWATRWKSQGRNVEPSLSTVGWDMLSIPEKEEIRAMARELARHHHRFVRRGHPQKTDLDAALKGLADIFLRYAGSSIGRYELSYKRQSQFIKFAVLALEPAAMYFEVSNDALSGRWERLVSKARRPAQPITKRPRKKKLLPH